MLARTMARRDVDSFRFAPDLLRSSPTYRRRT